jgi:hypothetical protein
MRKHRPDKGSSATPAIIAADSSSPGDAEVSMSNHASISSAVPVSAAVRAYQLSPRASRRPVASRPAASSDWTD